MPVGVSTGNEGECSAGTIGARVKHGTDVYALSNNHVYALKNDAVIGDETRDDTPSDTVLQPGRYDTNCDVDLANDAIGHVVDFELIVFSTSANNTIDAAIAKLDMVDYNGNGSIDGPTVGTSTPPDGYGTPSSTLAVLNILGVDVQKYGRTTGLTRGTVYAINFTVNVVYSSGTARFVDQIVVEGNKGSFIKRGDSGSLLVTEDEWANPVGLLFAGNRSGKFAFANRIDLVLGAFGVTIDGE